MILIARALTEKTQISISKAILTAVQNCLSSQIVEMTVIEMSNPGMASLCVNPHLGQLLFVHS